MSGLEALIAKCTRPRVIVSIGWSASMMCGSLLERDTVLRHGVEATLPYKCYVAGVGRRKAP
jgi:Ni,Fe-hydrogenase III small subunit